MVLEWASAPCQGLSVPRVWSSTTPRARRAGETGACDCYALQGCKPCPAWSNRAAEVRAEWTAVKRDPRTVPNPSRKVNIKLPIFTFLIPQSCFFLLLNSVKESYYATAQKMS